MRIGSRWIALAAALVLAGPSRAQAPGGEQTLYLVGASGTSTVTLFDALSRRVWQRETGGTSLDLPAVAPGLYVVRVRDTSGARASMRLLRR